MMSMIKKYKWTLILTGIVTLSPILFGVLFWNQLPQEIPTHFSGAGNTPDMGWNQREPYRLHGLESYQEQEI